MDFTESIKKMFEQGQKNKYVPSIPMNMATPLEGAKVRFWTKQTMKDSNARTIIDNSLVGEFKEGYFIIETDSWSVNEVFSWAKYTE